MKISTITLFLIGVFSFFTPIAILILCLMLFICIDTVVKLFALKSVAKKENKRYLDVYKSKILRKKFILKSVGYLALVTPISIIDIQVLTPFLSWFLSHFWQIIISSEILIAKAILTNALLIIFCLMEISSINENWDLLSGNNILKSVKNKIVELRKEILKLVNFFEKTKNAGKND